LRRTYGADRLIATVAAGKLLGVARQLMSLADCPSIITASMTSSAAMPTLTNLCAVIAVRTRLALLTLDYCPHDIVRLCSARASRPGAPLHPSRNLTATPPTGRFNSP